MQKSQITNSKSQTNHKSQNPKQFWLLEFRSLKIIWNLVLGIWNFQKREAQNGFTLLETIIAFAVIFAALIGPVSLITRGLIDVTFAKNKLVALNLAQEGIELVHLARDNNVLCDYLNGATVREFGQNSDSSPQYLYDTPQPRKADALKLESISCGAETLESPDFTGGSGAAEIRFYTGGPYTDFYGHAGAGGPSVETPFSRKITIEGIDGGSGVYEMKITSKVEWTERGRTRTVTLIDALYNWR